MPVTDYVSGMDEGAGNLLVGIRRSYFYDEDEEVRAAVEKALAVISSCGVGQGPTNLVAKIKEVHLEVPTDPTMQMAESYAYHAENVAKSPELYQPETLGRIRYGEKYLAAEYIQRWREMEEQRRRVQEIFAEVDVLVTPATSIPAPSIADLKKAPEALPAAELILMRNARPFNVWGLPAISLPCGLSKSGLPIGLQIAGPYWREDLVLRLAHAFEQATDWHRRSPELKYSVAS